MIDTKARYARARDLTLGQAFGLFLRELQPKCLIAHLLGWVGYRVYLAGQGDWGAWDILPIIAIFALNPFVEWLIHTYVLHHRPRKLLGLRWDYHSARYHRLHHRDPWDLRFVLMPLPAMVIGLASAALAFGVIAPSPGLGATAMIMTAGLALYYEWIHFLTHTSYRPQGWFYKRQWRFHRLHHYKNERYWMGVTRHLGDLLLGTFPNPDAVETSKTARTLGLDETGLDESGRR
jgi:sterol desaturase/sphingolipid hydroxylase (fatty acid hydroxylase superfamily)